VALEILIALASLALFSVLAWLANNLRLLLGRHDALDRERAAFASDNAGTGTWEWRLNQNDLIIADARLYRLYGLEPSNEPEHLDFWMRCMHEEDRNRVREELREAIAGAKPYNTEFRVVWKDGSVHNLRATGTVIRDGSGRALRMAGSNWDVTEARGLDARLSEQHDLFRVTLQSIIEGVITQDANRNVTWMNAAAERLTGWASVQVIGRPITEVVSAVHEKTRLPIDIHIALLPLAQRPVHSTGPVSLIARDGRECAIESTASPLYGSNGDALGSVLVLRDMTGPRRSAAETERADSLHTELKLKSDFLSHVSHELRSPLTSIYSFSSIIADGLAGETTEQQQEYLQIVIKNVVQLQSMIEDLLTVTQSKEGKLSIEIENVSAADAITDAMHTIERAAAAKGIELVSGEVSQPFNVFADPTRLRQILIILLDNAVKFTPKQGRISVEVSAKGPGFLLFQVTDTGCGIPIADRTRVFEKLYQVPGPRPSDTSSAGRAGLGLGLHIARNLVTRQGGAIWVTGPPTPDLGSTFNFTLPSHSAASDGYGAAVPRRRKTDLL
jgi:PAS domain S-box-containing protein